MAKKNYDLLFKLLLIGDSGVGKVRIRKTLIRTIDFNLDMYSISIFG